MFFRPVMLTKHTLERTSRTALPLAQYTMLQQNLKVSKKSESGLTSLRGTRGSYARKDNS